METGDLFDTSSLRIREFAEMQVLLYRHDPGLQQYFMQLQLKMQTVEGAASSGPPPVRPRFALPARAADKLSRFVSHKRYRADVLYCPAPYFDRKTENKLTVRTLMALAKTGASVLCLIPAGVPVRGELEKQLAASGRATQVEFLDPTAPFGPVEARLRTRCARMRAWKAFEEMAGVLEPLGVRFGLDSQIGFEHTASYVEAWERVAPFVEFETAVVRCHWNTLCSAVCQTAMARGKAIITFQQGVIGHTLDVPVTATKYVAFGSASASFLDRVNRRFHQAAQRSEPAVEYISGGSMIDDVHLLPDQFEQKTLLVVDVQVNQGDFYGVSGQCDALLKLVERLLASDLPFRRIIIRPHPYWTDLELEALQSLARAFSDRCELSHPAWSLEDNLRRSSAAIGIFSGALTVAASGGLPTYFLQTEHGFMTEDLACFASQKVSPDEAFRELGRILCDHGAYEMARNLALKNAREYYAGGKNLDFSDGFFERLLAQPAADSVTKQGVQ